MNISCSICLGIVGLALIWRSTDGKEEEKVVVVGKKDASGSAEKAAATGDLPCMDRLREELSCAVRGFRRLVSLGLLHCRCISDDLGE